MIIGRDFLQRAGININFQHGYMEWLGIKVVMKATLDEVQSTEENFFLIMMKWKQRMLSFLKSKKLSTKPLTLQKWPNNNII
eukprot:9036198-Ditylum_brightwellii.AAC.1